MRGQAVSTGSRNGLERLYMNLYQSEALLILGNCASGKEILKKVLIGKIKEYEGQFFWKEEPISGKQMLEIIQAHEVFYANPEEVLIEGYTVAENIYIIRNKRKGILPSRRSMNIQAANLLRELGFPLKPDRLVRELGYFEKLLVCLAKAASYESKVILFDYMDNILRVNDLLKIKGMMQHQKQMGQSFIIFAEKFDEVRQLADRVLLMSDGRDKKAALIGEIHKDEIPYYWLGEAYDRKRLRPTLAGRAEEDRAGRRNILGIYDKDWGTGEDAVEYLRELYRDNADRLSGHRDYFQEVLGSTGKKNRDCVCIENKEYDKLLREIPLAQNLLLPRNLREVCSRTSRIRETVMVEEFYKQFRFLRNRNRQYSDYFFYKLVAIYRFERFHRSLIILDNPFLQLDVAEEEHMREYLLQLSQKAKLILLSHRLHEIDRTADTIIYVEDGEIIRADKGIA